MTLEHIPDDGIVRAGTTVVIGETETEYVQSPLVINGTLDINGTVLVDIWPNRFADDRNIDLATDEWDNRGIDFNPQSNTYALVERLFGILDDFDRHMEEVYGQQHIDYATGLELDKWGDLTSVQRKTGEPDAKYRARVKAGVQAALTTATTDAFLRYSSSVLSTDATNIELNTSFGSDPAIVQVTADEDVYSALNLSDAEVKDILNNGVPAGHNVEVIEAGTFEVKAAGGTDDADKGLTGVGVSTGGTLAGPIN